jgi:hypothetical protein
MRANIATILIGLGGTVLFVVIPPTKKPMKMLVGIFAVGCLVYGGAFFAFSAMEGGNMKIPIWTAILIGGLVGGTASGLAWKHTIGKKEPQPPPLSAIVTQPHGNLEQRARELADEIMQALYRHGWPERPWAKVRPEIAAHIIEQIPAIPAELDKWVRERFIEFRLNFFKRVIETRDEFNQLHYVDQTLNNYLDSIRELEEINKQLATIENSEPIENRILPQMIERMAKKLIDWADELKQVSQTPNIIN